MILIGSCHVTQRVANASGTLVLVVGPSGAGKDTVMGHVAERVATGSMTTAAGIVFPRRVVTRAVAHGGEDCILVEAAEFTRRAAAGRFLLSWSAHGLHYGIPVTVRDDLAAGRMVVVNVSRAVIAAAETAVPRAAVVHITASPEIRAQRIAARGRETMDEIRGRIEREQPLAVGRAPVLEICNEGTVEAAADAVCRFLAGLEKG